MLGVNIKTALSFSFGFLRLLSQMRCRTCLGRVTILDVSSLDISSATELLIPGHSGLGYTLNYGDASQ